MNLQRALDRLVRGLEDILTNPTLTGLSPSTAIIRAFREAGATSYQRAQRFHVHTVLDEAAFHRLLHEGVIRKASAGRYYLDERTLRKRSVDLDRIINDFIRDDGPYRE